MASFKLLKSLDKLPAPKKFPMWYHSLHNNNNNLIIIITIITLIIIIMITLLLLEMLTKKSKYSISGTKSPSGFATFFFYKCKTMVFFSEKYLL